MSDAFFPQQTALLIVDLQNDFVHPDGAYGRAGQSAPEIVALPQRVKPLADKLRERGGFVVSTQFTLVPAKGGEPIISPHLKTLRPFLKKGDFQPGSWGHQLVGVLRKCDIRNLLVCGIVTNGGVASTVRDAHVRDFNVTVLEDACAAFSSTIHDTSIDALRPVCQVRTVADAIRTIENS
jgi:nicotinamidase-related amidase